jgi:hypothetical protein
LETWRRSAAVGDVGEVKRCLSRHLDCCRQFSLSLCAVYVILDCLQGTTRTVVEVGIRVPNYVEESTYCTRVRLSVRARLGTTNAARKIGKILLPWLLKLMTWPSVT